MPTGIISICGFAVEMYIATTTYHSIDMKNFSQPIPKASIAGSTFSIALLTIGFTGHFPLRAD